MSDALDVIRKMSEAGGFFFLEVMMKKLVFEKKGRN